MAGLKTKVTIAEVNRMDYDEFIEKFGNVIEHGPLIAAAVWSKRPFQHVKQLHEKICSFIDELPSAGKAGILRCHPDLAGKLASAGKLTQESTKEQSGSGLLSLTEEEKSYLQNCNTQYRQKFRFPFVICARENKKQAIMEGLKVRLQHSEQEELTTGVNEVKKIGWYRLMDLVTDGDGKL